MSAHTMTFGRSRTTAGSAVRLTARGRLVLAAMLLVSVVAVLVVAVGGLAARGQTPPSTTVVVQDGETLDTIAARYLPGMPRFEAVMLLDRANRLNSHHVETGQRLVIPEA